MSPPFPNMRACNSLSVFWWFSFLASDWEVESGKPSLIVVTELAAGRMSDDNKGDKCVTAYTFHHPALLVSVLQESHSSEIRRHMHLKNVSLSCLSRWLLPWEFNTYNGSWKQLQPPVNYSYLYMESSLHIVGFKPLWRHPNHQEQKATSLLWSIAKGWSCRLSVCVGKRCCIPKISEEGYWTLW